MRRGDRLRWPISDSRQVGAPPRGMTDERARPPLDRAAAHMWMGTKLPSRTRFGPLKRAVLRMTRFLTRDQIRFNEAALDSMREIAESTRSLSMRLDRMQRDLERFRVPDGGGQPAAAPPRAADWTPALDELYAAFEDVFRGSWDEIRRRLAVYLDDVRPRRAGPPGPVVDLGCGRGEWLDLLREHGIPAYGVESNDAVVRAVRERAVDVVLDDALDHLRHVPEGTLGAITGFHLIEHLPFPSVVELIDVAFRSLAAGGVLIFETPNPENVMVGACTFYLDPTHRAPVPPRLAKFLVASRGFADVRIRFLNPPPGQPFESPAANGEAGDEMRRIVEHLNRVFFSAKDYAVIGRKPSAVAPG